MWTAPTRRRHSRAGLRYGSDLTDAEQAILCPFRPTEADGGRKRAWPTREIVNAICYVLRVGIARRLTTDSFPLRRTVYRWFARLREDGTWETINHHLVMRDRERAKRPNVLATGCMLPKSSDACAAAGSGAGDDAGDTAASDPGAGRDLREDHSDASRDSGCGQGREAVAAPPRRDGPVPTGRMASDGGSYGRQIAARSRDPG
jgi:transposase